MSLLPYAMYNSVSSPPTGYPYSTGTGFLQTGPTLSADISQYLNTSTINATNIGFPGALFQVNNSNGGTILINGAIVATQSTINVADWATVPAVSTIRAGVGGGSIVMNTGSFSNLTISTINGLPPQGNVYVDGNVYGGQGDKTIPVSNVTVLVSTFASYTFTSNHAYSIQAPSVVSPVSYTGTGYMELGIEPTAGFGANSNVNRGSVTPYLNGLTLTNGMSLIQIVNGNYYNRNATFTSPLALWTYVFPGGVSNLVASGSLNNGASDVIYIQDLGLQVEH